MVVAPAREYFYDVDLSGRLLHDGGELTEPRFLDFFFKRLRPNDTGRFGEYPFLSPCAGELNFVRAADRPIVFHRLRGDELVYAATLTCSFKPAALGVSTDGRLYHTAPVGELGLLHSHVALQLGERIRQQGADYVLQHGGQEFRIRPLEKPA